MNKPETKGNGGGKSRREELKEKLRALYGRDPKLENLETHEEMDKIFKELDELDELEEKR